MGFAEILRKMPLIGKKSKISAEIIDEYPYSAEILHDGSYQEFMGHAIPNSVDLKQLKAVNLSHFPLINDPFMAGVIQMPFGRPPDVDRKTLMQYVKFTPEIISIFNAIIEDIISDGYRLEPSEDVRGSGKTKVQKAEQFLRKNHFKELLASALWDILGTGDAYIYKSGISPAQVRGLVEDAVNSLPIHFKADAVNHIMFKLMNGDEDIFSTRSLELIPSSTVKINYTNHGVTEYIQQVGMNVVRFSPEEVIHMRLWRLDGKVYGFTPMQSITREIDILSNVKDFARYYFEKGGVPNYLFIFKEDTPDSPSVKAFKKTLQLAASLNNKWKNIIATGEIEPIELNKMTQDMQFQQLAIYLTQVIVMAWQIPSSRLSDMLVAKGIRGATIATEGYYRKISHLQDVLEDIVNNEILAQFKVRLLFNKAYTEDEIKEAQREMFKADALMKKQSLLGAYNKKLTEKTVLRMFGLKEEDVEEGMAAMNQFPENRQGFMDNNRLLSPDREKVAQDDDKRDIATRNPKV